MGLALLCWSASLLVSVGVFQTALIMQGLLSNPTVLQLAFIPAGLGLGFLLFYTGHCARNKET